MQRTELLCNSAKESIEVMEKFVLAHNGQEVLEEYTARQKIMKEAAIARFAKLKLQSPAAVVVPPAGQRPPEILKDDRPLDEVIKSAVLKLQAKARGNRVRRMQREKELVLEKARLENEKLFAKEYASITTELENVANLERRMADLMNRLPSTVQKLVVGYEFRCYWFEIFECVRKLALTCLPQLPIMPPGSVDQLAAGLVIAFVTFAMYTAYSPYDDDGNDQLSTVCQGIVFFSILWGVVLKGTDYNDMVRLAPGFPIEHCLLSHSRLPFYIPNRNHHFSSVS